MITVAVVDDDRMLLDGLRSWLGSVPRIRVVAAVATVDELLTGLSSAPDGPGPRKAPGSADVVLLDLLLKDGSRPDTNIRRLRAAGSRVLIISTVADRPRIVSAVAAGADGYLTKDHDLETLVNAVEEVAAGGTAHSPSSPSPGPTTPARRDRNCRPRSWKSSSATRRASPSRPPPGAPASALTRPSTTWTV